MMLQKIIYCYCPQKSLIVQLFLKHLLAFDNVNRTLDALDLRFKTSKMARIVYKIRFRFILVSTFQRFFELQKIKI